MKNVAIVVIAVITLCSELQSPAWAQIDWSLGTRAKAEQLRWWNSLTPKQQYIVKAIDSIEEDYRTKTGQGCIRVNEQNLAQIMKLVDTSTYDEGLFVLSRMRKACETANLLEEANATIYNIDKQMLCGFLPRCYLP